MQSRTQFQLSPAIIFDDVVWEFGYSGASHPLNSREEEERERKKRETERKKDKKKEGKREEREKENNLNSLFKNKSTNHKPTLCALFQKKETNKRQKKKKKKKEKFLKRMKKIDSK